MNTYDQQMLLLFAMSTLADLSLLQDAAGRFLAALYLRVTRPLRT